VGIAYATALTNIPQLEALIWAAVTEDIVVFTHHIGDRHGNRQYWNRFN
jgi:hypothetical protein